MPAEAKEHTDAGAVAFAKYYWEALGRAQLTSDSSEIEQLVSPDCQPCGTLVKSFDELSAKNSRANINPIAVTTAEIADTTDGKSDEAATLEVESKAHVMQTNGKATGQVKAQNYTAIVYVSWQEGTWAIVDSYIIS